MVETSTIITVMSDLRLPTDEVKGTMYSIGRVPDDDGIPFEGFAVVDIVRVHRLGEAKSRGQIFEIHCVRYTFIKSISSPSPPNMDPGGTDQIG